MDLENAVLQRRSIRKFRAEPIPYPVLKKLVELCRLYPSGGNSQPLRFAIVSKPEITGKIFKDLLWAMYLPEFTVLPAEQPAAYIILLRDNRIADKCDYDIGAASTIVMLAATAHGLASCPVGNFHMTRLAALLELEETLVPELVIALGYPAQESSIIPLKDTVEYSQDPSGNFLVPKWDTEDILVFSDAE